MWQFREGTREELVNVYYYLKGIYPITDKVYGRRKIFGVIEEKTMPQGVWLFQTVDEDIPDAPRKKFPEPCRA